MIPLTELKQALRIDPDQTSEDGYLVRLEAAAVAHVERLTGRYFGPPAERVEHRTAYGQREIILANAPAAEPAPVVTVDGTPVAPTQVIVRGRTLRHVGAWAGVPGDIVVTYTAGYEVTAPAGADAGQPIADIAAPADVRQAVTMLVAHWFEQRTPVAVGTVAPEVAHTLRDILRLWIRHTA